MSCATCLRWARHPGGGYGRCAKARKGPQPYWVGKITRHDQIDTPDVHGDGCAADRPARAA